MLTAFTAKNLRCFRELHIAPLDRVNLITGKNNTGKTALLEAIFLYLGPHKPELSLRLDALRGGATASHKVIEELWGWLFLRGQLDRTITLAGTDDQHRQRGLHITLTQDEDEVRVADYNLSGGLSFTTETRVSTLSFQDTASPGEPSRMTLWGDRVQVAHLRGRAPQPAGIFLPSRAALQEADARHFSQLEQVGRQDEVLAPLHWLEPRLKRLAVLVNSDIPLIYGDLGLGRMIPLSMMGEGTGRLLSMLLAIANAPGGTVLIDEIENGLHHSVLVPVWRALAQMARQVDVQLFATTHSYECVTAAHEAFTTDGVYDLRVHRLERAGDDIHAITYDPESLAASLEQAWEIR